MALADRLKSLFKQGEGVVASNKDKAHQAVDKVAAEANKRTHGKYDDQIHTAEQKADEAVDKMGEQGRSDMIDKMGESGTSGTADKMGESGTSGTADKMGEPGTSGTADKMGEPGPSGSAG